MSKKKNKIQPPEIYKNKSIKPDSDTFNGDKKHLAFCFKEIPDCKIYGFRNISKGDKIALLDAIYNRRSFTWSEIKLEPREKLGFELIPKDDISGIPRNCTHNNKFMVFRVKSNTMSRMIGYRIKEIFYIVLYDKSGKAFPH